MTELECVTMVVFRRGYDDIDVEESGNGYSITASGVAGKLTAHGRSLESACENLVNKVVAG